MPYLKTPNVAMISTADWSSYRKTVSNCSPPEAQRIAMLDPTIRFFFYCRDHMTLVNPNWPAPRIFQPKDAVFFSGEPWWGSAPQCDGYVKDGLAVAYIDNLQTADPTIAGQYVTAQGLNAIDVVCLFAANLMQEQTGDYVRLAPDVPVPANGTLAVAHGYYLPLFGKPVAELQAKGITVLLSVLNGRDNAGWSQFATEENAASVAAQLASAVHTYGFDGIDIDDEYSNIQEPLPNSLAMVTLFMRQQMPDKILSKALFDDIYGYMDVFSGQYDGVSLAQNLSYGWQMSYANDPQDQLPPYVAA
jgi:hypothetical protein